MKAPRKGGRRCGGREAVGGAGEGNREEGGAGGGRDHIIISWETHENHAGNERGEGEEGEEGGARERGGGQIVPSHKCLSIGINSRSERKNSPFP